MRHNAPLLADNSDTIQPPNTGYLQASAPSVHVCSGAGERNGVDVCGCLVGRWCVRACPICSVKSVLQVCIFIFIFIVMFTINPGNKNNTMQVNNIPKVTTTNSFKVKD